MKMKKWAALAGNRLGGNAVTEIIVSGRTAAQAIEADNQ